MLELTVLLEVFKKTILVERIAEIQKWVDNVKNVQEDGCVRQAIIAANIHYAGFGSAVNIFRNML